MLQCGVFGRACSLRALSSSILKVSAVPAAGPDLYAPLLRPRCLMVSSYGRVQSLSGHIGFGNLTPSGYRVSAAGGRTRLVHRLVAEAFLGPPPSPRHVHINHKDGIKSNNHVTNLEYATPSQNVIHSFLLDPNRKTGGWMQARAVLGKRVGTAAWTWYPSIAEASRQLNLHSSNVSRCCRGLGKQAGGYEFKYGLADSLDNAPGEEWKQATHPDTGEILRGWIVSSEGRVKSSRTRVGWGTRCADRYRRVSAHGQQMAVHRLVARAFIGPPPDQERREINHIDGNKQNNRVSNLQWVSRRENVLHSYETNRHRKRGPLATSKAVLAQHKITRETAQYPSMHEAARRLNVSRKSIRACCYGRASLVGMYTYRFVEQVPNVLIGEEWRLAQVDTGS
ncbi:unnamed protein product [Prorocentrum cordatum]|uniref:HNH nuclease domain-containing protein n=1 Tax=Prorocentrum cordatum TaxID=2364126 RepID=A0ABN9W7K1_9DINO|nr:unnamed protein product [Polarella glacialis]